MKSRLQHTYRLCQTYVIAMNWSTDDHLSKLHKSVKAYRRGRTEHTKKPPQRIVYVFRIIPHNRFQQQLVPNAGKANNSRHCSHYRLPSPSQLCTTLGYVTNKPYKLPGGHLLVISEMKITCSGRF